MRKVLAIIAGLSLVVLLPELSDAVDTADRAATPAAIATSDMPNCTAPMPTRPPPARSGLRCRLPSAR